MSPVNDNSGPKSGLRRRKAMQTLVGLSEEQSAIDALVAQRSKDGEPLKLWFAGPPGIGKTTMAHNIAERLVKTPLDLMEISGTKVNQAVCDRLPVFFGRAIWDTPQTWKVLIINEADRLTEGAVFSIRTILDELKARRACICTTNAETPADLWGKKLSEPILSRFSEFHCSLRGKGKEIALFAKGIMESKGMNGKPLELYEKCWVRAYADNKGIRGYLARLEQGDWRTGRE